MKYTRPIVAGLALAAITAVVSLLVLRDTAAGAGRLPIGAVPEDPALCRANVAAVNDSDGKAGVALADAAHYLPDALESKTFALAVSDLDGDGRDDILIGAHEYNPYLLLNTGAGFADHSQSLFRLAQRRDRHGYALADLDGDRDLDIAVAGGGADGVGAGASNSLLRNLGTPGRPAFEEVAVGPALAMPPGRSRAFLPLAAADGAAVDLYYTTLQREGYPNRLFVNSRAAQGFAFRAESGRLPGTSVDDHGRGLVADFDDNGVPDYLAVEGRRARLYWNPAQGTDTDTLAYAAFSVAAADFDNDGRLDIFIGRSAGPSHADRVSATADELIFAMHRNGAGDTDTLSFTSASDHLAFNLEQHVPQGQGPRLHEKDASDIYLGAAGVNPPARRFTAGSAQAAGKPRAFDNPGTYIWYEEHAGRWHMRWRFYADLDVLKGSLAGTGIDNLDRSALHDAEPECMTDAVLLNRGGGDFERVPVPGAAHRLSTVDATVADFDNDGWPDILGIRHGEEGAENGAPFILHNQGGTSFALRQLPVREEDRLHRADRVAHGFLDADDRPDALITNGFGQHPGTYGSPRLLLNAGGTDYGALLLDLYGDNANTFGIGARLYLRDAGGALIGHRVQGLNSNISQDTHVVHFGLGTAAGPYELEVRWPDGRSSRHRFNRAGRYPVHQREAGAQAALK